MGKNQAYKAMQRARLGSSSAGPEEVEDGMVLEQNFGTTTTLIRVDVGLRIRAGVGGGEVLSRFCLPLVGMEEEDSCSCPWTSESQVDGSFHSPEWHAARLASLKTSHTITWEEFKKKQKEEEVRKGELEADKDRMMREYRAQLDAERARKLAHGKNHSSSRSNRRKDKKEKDSRKHTSKKRKHSRRSSDSSSSSSSETSSSDEEKRESKRSKSRLKRRKKEKKHRSRSKHSSSESEEADGPLPLSRFFGSGRGSAVLFWLYTLAA
ncbi:UNVERIFIED_CONTAM: hypothetical protein Sindi_0355600 [Sesamum indicum]